MLLCWHGTKPHGPEGTGSKGSELNDMAGKVTNKQRKVSISCLNLKELLTFLEMAGSKVYLVTAHLACESRGLTVFVN